MSVLQILVGHELNGAMNHSEQSRDEPLVKPYTALVLDDLQEGVQHARVVPLAVHLGRGQFLLQTQPGLDDSDGVGEDERQQPGGGGRHQVFPCGQLLVGVSVLEPRLDGLGEDRSVEGSHLLVQTTNLIEEEVGAPGGASSQNVGRHPSIKAPQPLGPHDGGHGVPDVGIASTARPAIVHSKPRNNNNYISSSSSCV